MTYEDICIVCHSQYEYTPANSRLRLFIEDPRCNHVRSFCPQKHEKLVYLKPYEACKMLFDVVGMPITVIPEAMDEERARAEKAWAEVDEVHNWSSPSPDSQEKP